MGQIDNHLTGLGETFRDSLYGVVSLERWDCGRLTIFSSCSICLVISSSSFSLIWSSSIALVRSSRLYSSIALFSRMWMVNSSRTVKRMPPLYFLPVSCNYPFIFTASVLLKGISEKYTSTLNINSNKFSSRMLSEPELRKLVKSARKNLSSSTTCATYISKSSISLQTISGTRQRCSDSTSRVVYQRALPYMAASICLRIYYEF
jgi:hypothetical protein